MSASCPHILVIGCGSIGRRHTANLTQHSDAKVSVFDTDPQRCNQTALESGVSAVTDLDRAWSGVDVAVVAAPTQHHMELADQAVQNGCDLFLEKPISYRTDGIESLCDQMAQNNLIDMVACNMRFHPGPMTVKKWIDDGAVGEVLGARLQTGSYLPNWRPGQDYRSTYSADPVWGGAILDCIHEIDLALWYLGPGELIGACWAPARSISLAETDGLAELILRHDSGALCNIHVNFVQRDYRRTCQIIGSIGTIFWDMERGSVVLHGADGRIIRTSKQPESWQDNQMYADQMAHFLRCVHERCQTVNPVHRATASLHIALQAKQVDRGALV